MLLGFKVYKIPSVHSLVYLSIIQQILLGPVLHSTSVLVTQSCPILYDPVDYSLPASFVQRIL